MLRAIGIGATGTALALVLLVIVVEPPRSRGLMVGLVAIFLLSATLLTRILVERLPMLHEAGNWPPVWRRWFRAMSAGAVITGLLLATMTVLPSDPWADSSRLHEQAVPGAGATTVAPPTLAASSFKSTEPSPTSPNSAPTENPRPRESARPASTKPQPPVGSACASGYVCVYPGRDPVHSKPQFSWFDYKTYNLKKVYGARAVFNHQWSGAWVVAFEGYDGEGRCLHALAPGVKVWDWTPINSVRLSKSKPAGCPA